MYRARLVLAGVGLTLVLVVVAAAEPPAVQKHPNPLEKVGRRDAHGDLLPPGAVARVGTSRWRTYESVLVFSPDGRRAIAVSRDAYTMAGPGTRLVDALSGKVLRTFDLECAQAFFMADNKTVILANPKDRAVSFLNVETGQITRTIPISGYVAAWSSDGKSVACWNQDRGPRTWDIGVWSLDSGKEVRKWQIPVGDLALSPDGKTLALRFRTPRAGIALLDVLGGKELRRWETQFFGGGNTRANKRFAFSPDGKTIASTEGTRVALWDLATGKPVPQGNLKPFLPTPNGHPDTLTFSADGHYLAVGCDNGTIYIWDLAADKLLHSIPDAGRGLPIYVLNFTADGKTLVSQAHQFPSARLWDVASGKDISPPDANATKVESLAFSPDGMTIATGGPGDPTCLWDASSGKLLRRFESRRYMGAFGGTVAFFAGGKSLAAQWRDESSIWKLDDGAMRYKTKDKDLFKIPKEEAEKQIHINCTVDDDTVVAVFPGDDKRVIPRRGGRFGGPDTKIRWTMIGLWHVRTGKVSQSFRVDAETLFHLELSKDGRTALGIGWLPGSQEMFLFGWDLRKGKELFRIALPPFDVCEGILLSPDGKSVVVNARHADAGNVRHSFYLFDVALRKIRSMTEHKLDDNYNSWSVVANEGLAAVAQRDTIYLIHPLTGKELGRLKSGEAPISSLAFSKDGKYLASGSEDTTALIWDTLQLSFPAPFLPQMKDLPNENDRFSPYPAVGASPAWRP